MQNAIPLERLGSRVAELRHKLGLTQQQLADRLAISRVAVSHLESGISVASERTVALLAGLFKIEPAELVAGTDYPVARAERLPRVVARYTEGEQLAAVVRALVEAFVQAETPATRHALGPWRVRVLASLELVADGAEQALLRDTLRLIDEVSFDR